jgi:hypothetical protein
MKKRLYIFGGYDGENRLNDFHYFVLADEETSIQQNSLKQDLSQYINSETFSDLELVIEGFPKQSIFAHRIMLSRCPYFANLIDREDEKDLPTCTLIIKDMNYDTAL